jgi:hypothetical protein
MSDRKKERRAFSRSHVAKNTFSRVRGVFVRVGADTSMKLDTKAFAMRFNASPPPRVRHFCTHSKHFRTLPPSSTSPWPP